MAYAKVEWVRAKLIKQRDFFKISKPFVHGKPFMPSYENEGHPSFNRLVTMDYLRTWKTERDEYVDQLKTIENKKKNEKRERSKSRADKRAASKSDTKKENIERNRQDGTHSSKLFNKTKKTI